MVDRLIRLPERIGGYHGAMTRSRIATCSVVALLSLGSLGVTACSDEDGDGGVTDEEIHDGKDTATSIAGEAEEEVDAQDEGTNHDGE